MTPHYTKIIATFTLASVAAISAPLAAESAVPMETAQSAIVADVIDTKPMAMVAASTVTTDAMASALPSPDRSALGQLNVARVEANILNWNNEFAMINEATPLANAARGGSAKQRSFALDTVTPDFGEPETLASEFALVQGVTFQPRAPVRQATGAEFEQTYAFAPTTDAASRLDGNVSTVGRATNVRVRF